MKKYHWHVFRHEKLFEKQPLPYCQTQTFLYIDIFCNCNGSAQHGGPNILFFFPVFLTRQRNREQQKYSDE